MWRKKQIQRSMDMEHNEDDFNGYNINYDMVVKSKSCLAVTRLLAADLMNKPYMTVGDFMRGLTDEDLETLAGITDNEDNPKYEDLILITQMLCSAEGLENTFDIGEVNERMSQFILLLTCEQLARKGMVKIYHENMSFGPDMENKIVVEKLED
jgi:hypothetical protein